AVYPGIATVHRFRELALQLPPAFQISHAFIDDFADFFELVFGLGVALGLFAMAILFVGERFAFGIYLLFDVTQFLAQPGGLLRYELAAFRDRGLMSHQLRRSGAVALDLLRQISLLLARALGFQVQRR